MTLKTPLFIGKADIIAAIADVNVKGKALDELIWATGASIVAHIEEHGNYQMAADLIAAMPKGSRVNALIAYFEAVSKLTFNPIKKALEFDKTKTTNQELAQTKSWVEYKPEQPYNGFDLKAAFTKFMTQAMLANAVTDETKLAKIKISGDHLDALKLVATQMGIELSEPKTPVAATQVTADPLNAEPVTT